jgi:hypothetical protein
MQGIRSGARQPLGESEKGKAADAQESQSGGFGDNGETETSGPGCWRTGNYEGIYVLPIGLNVVHARRKRPEVQRCSERKDNGRLKTRMVVVRSHFPIDVEAGEGKMS